MKAGVISYGLQGLLIGACSLAAHSLQRSSNSALNSARAPFGALLGAYILDTVDYENVSFSTRVVRSAVPAVTSGLVANTLIPEGESASLRDTAYVLAAGAAGQIFARKYVRAEDAFA